MKNKVLYVNGCSFAYGVGIRGNWERLSLGEPGSGRFSDIVASKLGYDELNVAVPGSCNARIARRTALDLIKLKPDLAIIMWSDPARFEFMEPKKKEGISIYSSREYWFNADAVQVRPVSVRDWPRWLRHAFMDYYEFIAVPEKQIFDTLYQMVSTKMIADALGIRCIQIPFKDSFYIELRQILKTNTDTPYLKSLHEFIDILSADKSIFGITENISFDSISGCDIDKSLLSQFPNQLGHPGKEAHSIMADWLLQVINHKI